MTRARTVDLSATKQPLLAVKDIWHGPRHRRDFGHVPALANSIAARGLLQPIVIKPDGELIDGESRLRAYRDVLGWDLIPVHVVDVDSVLLGQHDANAVRANFLPSEAESIRRAIALEREARGLAGETRNLAAQATGLSNRTHDKIAAVCAAAERDPGKFGHLVEEMDRRRKVDGTYKTLLRLLDQDRVAALEPTPGKFRTLVFDPPWESGWYSDQVGPEYATMTPDELRALDVAAWCEPETALYCWVPNNFLPLAVDLVRGWGFEHRSVLTWIKPKFGLGHYFRNSSEQVLFATRGEAKTRSRSIPTTFEAPVGQHSEKPEAFYEIVRAASFPSYGEAFQRQARPDFTNLFRPGDGARRTAPPALTGTG